MRKKARSILLKARSLPIKAAKIEEESTIAACRSAIVSDDRTINCILSSGSSLS
ncbi:hypothetical protein [Leptolyngbya sp. FACHB-17]|uniref:hypothetical protein n=1 Tax=unclassified Leptolyngbya TaxID=2650499 RepID=UPI00168067B0|nr:hypothetical protein [Leptolyngbya sp. FACHB-17]MBD2078982.1 hypothetical protein [Leptolyngbya sp. FACHB-17]